MAGEAGVAAKPTVAVDIDEVLCKFIDPLAAFAREHFGATETEDDFFSMTFRLPWRCDETESTRRVQAFLGSSAFTGGVPVIDGAKEALAKLQAKYRLVVVTSRQTLVEEITREWIETEFPGVFSAVHFGNHWGLEGKKTTKAEMCIREGAVALIDDNHHYAREVAAVAERVVLFGEYPWNVVEPHDPPLPDNVTRALDWEAVVDALL